MLISIYIYTYISRSTNEISGASPESQDMWEKEVTPAEEEKAKVKAGMGWIFASRNLCGCGIPEKNNILFSQFHRRNDETPCFLNVFLSEENGRCGVYTVYTCIRNQAMYVLLSVYLYVYRYKHKLAVRWFVGGWQLKWTIYRNEIPLSNQAENLKNSEI